MSPTFLNRARSLFAALALAALACAGAAAAAGEGAAARWFVVASFLGGACFVSCVEGVKTLAFTAWTIAAVVAAVATPRLFQPLEPGSPEYKTLILLLVQAVMFGMGAQMRLRDFLGVVRTPAPVAIGLACQFTIMPLVGYGLAVAFRLPPEIAAGMVLIGSCSSGLASNVMAYLGRANLALSITLTSVATMMAPVVTPFWMKTLASSLLEGTAVELSFVRMMIGVVKIVVAPIGAALLHDYLLTAGPRSRRVAYAIGAAGVAWAVVWWGGALPLGSGLAPLADLSAWLLVGVALGVAYHLLVTGLPRLADVMPLVSMAGIIYVTGMTTAEGRENLFAVGGALVAAVVLHNTLGFFLGYWMSRLLGMEPQSARTVAFEVGMQNGGMATGLAIEIGRLATLGLPAAVFIAWMNIAGSLLASFWRNRPPNEHENHAPADSAAA